LTYFNTWLTGPPVRGTNRPTWRVPGCLRPSPPLGGT